MVSDKCYNNLLSTLAGASLAVLLVNLCNNRNYESSADFASDFIITLATCVEYRNQEGVVTQLESDRLFCTFLRRHDLLVRDESENTSYAPVDCSVTDFRGLSSTRIADYTYLDLLTGETLSIGEMSGLLSEFRNNCSRSLDRVVDDE